MEFYVIAAMVLAVLYCMAILGLRAVRFLADLLLPPDLR